MKRSLFVTHLGLWLLTASTAVAGKPAPRQLTAKEALRLAISMPPAPSNWPKRVKVPIVFGQPIYSPKHHYINPNNTGPAAMARHARMHNKGLRQRLKTPWRTDAHGNIRSGPTWKDNDGNVRYCDRYNQSGPLPPKVKTVAPQDPARKAILEAINTYFEPKMVPAGRHGFGPYGRIVKQGMDPFAGSTAQLSKAQREGGFNDINVLFRVLAKDLKYRRGLFASVKPNIAGLVPSSWIE